MKGLNLFLSVLLALMVTGCVSGSENEEPASPAVPTSYTVKLDLGGDYVTVGEEPMVRNEMPKQYYGINVLCKKTDGFESNYTNYAYGVFDNTHDMVITLLSGYKYKFQCTLVKEDGDQISVVSDCLPSPFLRRDEEKYSLNNLNKFITTSYDYLTELEKGYTVVKYMDTYLGIGFEYPSTDRYYGEVSEFEAYDDATAIIPMKHTAFGLKMVINGVPDGRLGWYAQSPIANGEELTVSMPTNSHEGTAPLECQYLYAFENVGACWRWNGAEPYSEKIKVYFYWIRANGYRQEFDVTVNAKANMVSVINVNLNSGSNNVGIGFNEDDTPMGSETIYVDYDGGTGGTTL